MSHQVILSVPLRCKEALNWSGPASAQMIMEGYPTGSCSVLQEDVNVEIQNNKTEMMWNADPQGMEKAMENLCPPTGGWSIYHRADPEELMYWVARWMTRNGYPVAIVADTAPAEHWIAITGIQTNADPTTVSEVELELIWINDPGSSSDPVGTGCMTRVLAGSIWYSEFQPVTLSGSGYSGEYVAVIEPPEVEGKAVAIKEVLEGRVIPIKEALGYAFKWIKEYRLDEMEAFRILKEAKPSPPLLVNEKLGGYYIIPFTTRESASVAMIINAYTGNLQEAGSFTIPVKYLSQVKAIKIAARYLGKGEPEEAKAELIFKRGKQTSNRYLPLWNVTIGDRVLQITQRGSIFTKELPHVPPKAHKVRVILDQVKILYDMDPLFQGKGELVFRSAVTPDNDRDQSQITRLPESGVYHISDTPGKNVVTIEKIIFEGTVTNALEVVFTGSEKDVFNPDDELRRYKRTFKGTPSDWAGKYYPYDEYMDKEDIGIWQVWYRIVVE
jgi:hypothetical protein